MTESERRFLMWGQMRPFSAKATVAVPLGDFSGQLVKVAHEIPNLWRVYMWLELTSTDVGSLTTGESLTATFSVNFGVGEAQTTRPLILQILPGVILPGYANSDEQGPVAVPSTGIGPGTPGDPSVGIQRGPIVPFEIPAQSINIGVRVFGIGGGGRDITYNGNVGAFVAPRYYPGNARLDPPPTDAPPQSHWMPPGFHDEPLKYGR